MDRPLTPGERILINRPGRAAGVIGAVWVTGTAGGYLLGRLVLGPIVGHACYAYDQLRERTRR
jgi:hypothetical protein